MGHSLLNLNIIMNKSLYNLYSFLCYSTQQHRFSATRAVRTTSALRVTCCCSCCRVLIPYLTTLAFGDPRGANYVRTTRDLSPLVLSSNKKMRGKFLAFFCYFHKLPHSPRWLPPSWLPGVEVSTFWSSLPIFIEAASICSASTFTSVIRGDT